VDPHGRSKFSLESNATGTFLVAREAIPSGTLVMTDPGVSALSHPNTSKLHETESSHTPGCHRYVPEAGAI